MVTAPSYLIDRFVPDCEIIALPEKTVAGGTLTVALRAGRFEAAPAGGRLQRLFGRKPATHALPGRIIVDLRLRTPDNWAHILNNHLPLLFRAAAALDLDLDRVTALLPAACPGYIRAAFDLFGLQILATDDTVTGDGVAFEVSPWTAVRAERAGWVRLPEVRARLDARVAGDADLPRRVFLARKSTRALSNMDEIRQWFDARGFVSLYPEDLSAADQFRLFRQAETVAAIHGAALAPLLYHRPEFALRRLIEILPCGHMTDVYRVMAHQTGIDWIGVRGRIKAEYVAPAYTPDAAFKAFSLDDFHVDPASLEQAFELIEETAYA